MWGRDDEGSNCNPGEDIDYVWLAIDVIDTEIPTTGSPANYTNGPVTVESSPIPGGARQHQ